jgi:hypothetical protein
MVNVDLCDEKEPCCLSQDREPRTLGSAEEQGFYLSPSAADAFAAGSM